MSISKNFSNIEKHIVACFKIGSIFQKNGIEYKILKSGKPRPSKGECKTDLYVETITDQKKKRRI